MLLTAHAAAKRWSSRQWSGAELLAAEAMRQCGLPIACFGTLVLTGAKVSGAAGVHERMRHSAFAGRFTKKPYLILKKAVCFFLIREISLYDVRLLSQMYV